MSNAKLIDGEYAMYLRKSRADLDKERMGEFETLAKHDRELTAMCERDGRVVVDKYKELVSGESVAERHEFQRLMSAVTQRKYAGIVVHAVDRLGRGDMMEYGWILSVLQYTGTLVVTPAKVYNPADPMDMQSLQFQMLFSNTELINSKRRLAAGREQSVRDGNFIGSVPPFGYRKVVTPLKQHTLEPNEDAATLVMIFEEVAAGSNVSTIAKKLTRSGVASPMGSEWTPSRIKWMIRNVTYKGMVKWQERITVVDSRDGLNLKKKRVWNDSPVIVKGLHQPIVSDELWEVANEALDKLYPAPKVRTNAILRNVLAGLLRCGKCGHTMRVSKSVQKNVTYGYYSHYFYAREKCCKGARVDKVVELVVDALKAIAANLEMEIAAGENSAKTKAEKEMLVLERELASAQRTIDGLVELFTAEPRAISIEEFRTRKAPVDERIEMLTERLAELRSMEFPDPASVKTNVHKAIDTILDDSLEAGDKNHLLKQIIERVDYYNDGVARGEDNIRLEIFLK